MRNLKTVLVNDFGLDLSEWATLTRATGISADGLTVVGYGNHIGLGSDGWIAVLPEPSTFALFLVTIIGIGFRRLVKRKTSSLGVTARVTS